MKHYPEMTGKVSSETAKIVFYSYDRNRVDKDRSELLKRMGVDTGEPPIFIENSCGKWVNPFFVFKFYGQHGLPPEFLLDRLGEKLGIDIREYWYEWCDFWLDTFLKGDIKRIRENFIID